MHAGGPLSSQITAGPPAGGRIGWWRRSAHGLAIVAGWFLFFWGWQRVLARQPDFSELRILMAGAAIVVPVVTLSWILHNRGIHKRKGPRRQVAVATLDYRLDFHGREVVADFRVLADARRVDIVAEGSTKRYLVGRAPSPSADATCRPRVAESVPVAPAPAAPLPDPPPAHSRRTRDDSPAAP